MNNTALLSAFLLTATLQAQATKDYMPLQVGNQWTFAGNGSAEVSSVIDRTEEINGVTCAVVATKMQGKTVNEEWLAVADGALRSYQNRVPQTGREMTFGKPIIRLQYPVKNGDRWTSSTMDETGDTLRGTYVVEFPVTLAIGGHSYETAKVAASIRSAQGTMNMETWYAEGVGIVKQAYQTQNGEMAFVLKDCKLAPASRPTPKPDENTPVIDDGPVRSIPKPEISKCQKCNEPMRPGTKFCGECGAPAPKPQPTKCQACNAKLTPGVKFCGECGAKVASGKGERPGLSDCNNPANGSDQ